MREPFVFTFNDVKNLAIDMYSERITSLTNDLSKLTKELNAMSKTQQIQFLEIRENQYKNQLREKEEAAILRKAPPEIKELTKMKNNLKEEQKQHKKAEKAKKKIKELEDKKKTK